MITIFKPEICPNDIVIISDKWKRKLKIQFLNDVFRVFILYLVSNDHYL